MKEMVTLEAIMAGLTPQRRAAVVLRARKLMDEQIAEENSRIGYGEELRKNPGGNGDFG